MKSFDNSFTVQNIDKVKAICKPLFANRVAHFIHDITFKNGELSELTTEPQVYETWSQKRPSAVFVNESGRILNDGIYLSDVLMKQDQYYKDALNIVLPVIRCDKILEIVEKESDCQHMFHFAINYDGDDYHQWLLNNIDVFKKFINHYKKAANTLIKEVKNVEHRMVLPIRSEYNEQNLSHFKNVDSFSKDYKENKKTITVIHHTTFEPITFAKQQSLCLKYLTEGKTAKDIATCMGLSFRTVEHYLETIRKRLDCGSNIELISKYHDQISYN